MAGILGLDRPPGAVLAPARTRVRRPSNPLAATFPDPSAGAPAGRARGRRSVQVRRYVVDTRSMATPSVDDRSPSGSVPMPDPTLVGGPDLVRLRRELVEIGRAHV